METTEIRILNLVRTISRAYAHYTTTGRYLDQEERRTRLNEAIDMAERIRRDQALFLPHYTDFLNHTCDDLKRELGSLVLES